MCQASKHLKLAIYALTEHFSTDTNMIMLKKSWADKNVDKGIMSLIIPNPLFCSDFLVVNKETKAINNVAVKIVQADPDGDKSYKGTITFTEHELKGLIDDQHLYSNVMMSDGKLITKSDSYVIIVSVIGKGRGVYISRAFPINVFITPLAGYEKTMYAKQCKDSFFAKTGYVDDRPYKPGSAVDCFNSYVGSYGKCPGFTTYFRKNTEGTDVLSKVIFPWKMLPPNLGVNELNRNFPIKLKTPEEVTAAIDSVPESAISVYVGISGSGDNKTKKLDRLYSSPGGFERMYTKYIESNIEGTIKDAAYSVKKAARVSWLKENFPNHTIFPSYIWYANSPLRYCHESCL